MIPDPAYRIRDLIHSYRETIALDIPEFDVLRGDVCCLTGPNGCGKSTLLSIMALLRSPASGSVLLDGEETARGSNPRLRRKVTLIHQKPVLFSTTVRNNVAYGLRAHGLAAQEINTRVSAALEEMELIEFADRQGHALSGGEAQRVALARALVLETPVLLLDEPTNSLDDASRPLLYAALRKAHRKGTTIVVATHDSGILDSLSGQVLRLDHGRIAGATGWSPL